MVNPDPNPFGSQDFEFLDPDPRIKISSKNCKKKIFHFSIKVREKNKKKKIENLL